MKEAVFILAVIAVLLALTAVRYRRQIVAAIQIWKSMKAMRQQFIKQAGMHQAGTQSEPAPIDAGKLVNCAKCGTWVPEQRALKLRNGTSFCSSACLESVTTNV